jgi:arginine utilization regulatory protein
MDLFRSYSWPGNIRELEHLIEGALNIVGYDEKLSLKYFSPALDNMNQSDLRQNILNRAAHNNHQKKYEKPGPDETTPLPTGNLPENQSKQERQALCEVLGSTNGNISRSSKILGISRQLLHYKMKKHGLLREKFMSG